MSNGKMNNILVYLFSEGISFSKEILIKSFCKWEVEVIVFHHEMSCLKNEIMPLNLKSANHSNIHFFLKSKRLQLMHFKNDICDGG